MPPTLARSLLSWLCLLAFALGSALPRTGVVLCSDGQSPSRLEWSCAKDDLAQCLTLSVPPLADAQQAIPDAPLPCKDTPLGRDLSKAPARSCPSVQSQPMPAPPVAILAAVLAYQVVVRQSPAAPAQARPPDILARLRSVILIV